jgi:hypothetical protein
VGGPHDAAFWLAVGQIIWINILLSGDNAVVIALACRSLPPRQRFWGILLGAGAAVVLRIVFTSRHLPRSWRIAVPQAGRRAAAALDRRQAAGSERGGTARTASRPATRCCARCGSSPSADIVMSLDNVIAIAAAAESAAARVDLAHALTIKTTLIVFGLATSVPLIIAGSALLVALLNRFRSWSGPAPGCSAGSAGEIMIKDAGGRGLARRGSWSTACTCGPPRRASCS